MDNQTQSIKTTTAAMWETASTATTMWGTTTDASTTPTATTTTTTAQMTSEFLLCQWNCASLTNRSFRKTKIRSASFTWPLKKIATIRFLPSPDELHHHQP